MKNGLYNMDCMKGMQQFPDKYFDLAIVDPPYGGGAAENEYKGAIAGRFGGRFEKYHMAENDEERVKIAGGGQHSSIKNAAVSEEGLASTISAKRTGGTWQTKYTTNGGILSKDTRHWDIAPSPEYFTELARVSKNQIIWGGNYFDLPPTRCFLVWRKLTIGENFSMAMCEYAWTSFNENAKIFERAPQDKERFHPTQKPVALYKWILGLFAHHGDKILDTHAGSASSLVACHQMGYQAVGFEVDKTYYELAAARLEREQAKGTLFNISEV